MICLCVGAACSQDGRYGAEPPNAVYHANGIERFESGGRQYLALTLLIMGEAVILNCPCVLPALQPPFSSSQTRARDAFALTTSAPCVRRWTYPSEHGGGQIVQRFGTPWYWNASVYAGNLKFREGSTRWFGVRKQTYSMRQMQEAPPPEG